MKALMPCSATLPSPLRVSIMNLVSKKESNSTRRGESRESREEQKEPTWLSLVTFFQAGSEGRGDSLYPVYFLIWKDLAMSCSTNRDRYQIL